MAGRAPQTARGVAAGMWEGLRKLEQLRDPLDTSGMLSHALLACAPRLFYGQSDEAQFLRTLIITALAPGRPPLTDAVRHHLEKRFGFRFADIESEPKNVATALQRTWYTYTSALSRKIIFEVAAEEMGGGKRNGGLTEELRAARTALRRAIVSGKAFSGERNA